MIAGVRLCDRGIIAACRPVELAGIYDYSAEGGAVTAEELGGGMDYDVRAVLNGADEVRCAEGVVDHKRKSVPVRQSRQSVDVRNVAVGVSEGFDVNRPCVVLNCVFNLGEIVNVYERCGDPEAGERVGQQIVASAVNGFLSYEVSAVLTERFQRVGDSRGTGGECESGNASLKGGDALFKHVLRGVGQSAVDVSGVCKTEARRRMSGIVKYVRGGRVNRYGAGIGGGVGIFLTDVELKCFEFII